jgi:hypothetical protein
VGFGEQASFEPIVAQMGNNRASGAGVVRTLVTRQVAAMIEQSGMYLQDLANRSGIPVDLLAAIKVGAFEPNQAQMLALVRALASPEEVHQRRVRRHAGRPPGPGRHASALRRRVGLPQRPARV